MYHTIVASIAKKNFELVNNKEYDQVISACSPTVSHKFGGDHSLGGSRKTPAAFKRWLQRLGTCAPGLHLTVTDVWVKGWPWDTTAIVRWDASDKSFTFPDGRPYANHGVHIIKMKWGKVYDIDANEDSQHVAEMLQVRASQGLAEATMPQVK